MTPEQLKQAQRLRNTIKATQDKLAAIKRCKQSKDGVVISIFGHGSIEALRASNQEDKEFTLMIAMLIEHYLNEKVSELEKEFKAL